MCKEDAAKHHRQTAESTLFEQLTKIHTPACLVHAIHYGLEHWDGHLKDSETAM
jgi:hypothetical protein